MNDAVMEALKKVVLIDFEALLLTVGCDFVDRNDFKVRRLFVAIMDICTYVATSIKQPIKPAKAVNHMEKF